MLLRQTLFNLRPRPAGVITNVGRKPCLRKCFSSMPPVKNTPTSLYTLREEEEQLRSAVHDFAKQSIQPLVHKMDEAEKLDPVVLKGLFSQGLMGIETSADHGGAEASFTSVILAVEQLARVDPSVSVICDVQNTLVNTLIRAHGTEEQKKHWLPKLAQDTVGCFCLSESAAGSDAFALQTRAKRDGDDYILSGGKMWITNSYEADMFLVFANVDPSKKHRGITCFIVEKSHGVTVAKKEIKLGIRASSTCALSFDDVRIPAANVLGEVGQGYKYAIEILNEGRIGIAAQMIGLAQGSLDVALPYLTERKQFGRALADFQGMQFQVAQVLADLEGARLLTYNAARLKEEGKDFITQAAMAKLVSSQVAERTASRAVEWMGGNGFTREFPVEKFYRDCKIGAIYEGTTNIQLQTIAKNVFKEISKS